MKIQRVSLHLIVILVLLIGTTFTGIFFIFKYFNNQQESEVPCFVVKKDHPNDKHVVIFDNSAAHDEVIFAFTYIFASLKGIKIDIFKDKYRYNMQEVLKTFDPKIEEPRPIRQFFKWMKNDTCSEPAPDIIFFNTCEWNFCHYPDEFMQLLNTTTTKIFCVIHQAYEVLILKDDVRQTLNAWVKAGRIRFLTLSPHVIKYVRTYIRWLKNPVIDYMVPIFPINSTENVTSSSLSSSVLPREIHLAVQGYYEAERRDYMDVIHQIRAIGESEDLSQKYKFYLHLLGNGKRPEVPKDMQDRILFHDNLTYKDFYQLLTTMDVILPSLNSPDYTWNKISSTIPASLIVGVPIIATPQIIEAYTFINESHVWHQDDRTEIEIMIEVLERNPKDIEEKKANVRDLSHEIMRENIVTFGKWIHAFYPDYEYNT